MRARRLLQRFGDPALAVLLGAGAAAEALAWPHARLPLAAVLAALAGLLTAGRRRVPLLSALLVVIALQGLIVLAPRLQTASLLVPAVFLLTLYSLGRHARGLEAWLGVVLVAALVVLLTLDDGGPVLTEALFFLLFTGLPWGAGLAVRLRVERVRDLRARADAVREETRRAVAAERARIARELHDVVSHAIAVTVLQARGTTRLVGRDDDAVRAALQAIEAVDTAALADMRRLLAVLRATEASAPEPPPSLDRLGELLDHARAAGLRVDLRVTGTAAPLPPAIDLCAYRCVQEALTNALKHGGPQAVATVRLHHGDEGLRVEVDSTLGGDPAGIPGGHGLTGLAERVGALGGVVEAGPGGTGWLLRADVPFLAAVPA